jgi:hypothetical protein
MSEIGDALVLESRRWSNWLAEAENDRDQTLMATQRMAASKGTYGSGGRVKEDIGTVFKGIESIAGKAVTLRKEPAEKNPELAAPENIAPLKEKIDVLIKGGISLLEGHISRTMQNVQAHTKKAFADLITGEAARLSNRTNNDLDNISLELRLMPKNNSSVHIYGNPGSIINVDTELSNSIQTLNNGGDKEIAGAIRALAEGIKASSEIDEQNRKDVLEHLSVVTDEVAKPIEKRKGAPLLSSLERVASVASIATKLTPLRRQLHDVLVTHHILAG